MFRRLKQHIENIPYYRYREHWHLLPGIKHLLCWLGRHYIGVDRITQDGHVELFCFLCDYRERTKPANE